MNANIELLSIDEAVTTEDGERILIRMKLLRGENAVLSLPASEVVTLIDVTAAANAQSDIITSTTELPATSVSWFELGEVENGDDFFLTLTFGSGGRLTFVLQRDMASQLAAALHSRLAQSG
jgi:hypothetical protein